MVHHQLVAGIEVGDLLASTELLLLHQEPIVEYLIDLAIHLVVEVGWFPHEVTLSAECQLTGHLPPSTFFLEGSL
jgi:hypothetical protein